MNLLAFDTSTDQMSVAVQRADGRLFAHQGAGGAQASATLIPTVLHLLAEAGVALRELRTIAFGAGPGSFTGLRTACAVAQGLGFGAGVALLPVNTLLAVAEAARMAQPEPAAPARVLALLDARMNEVYSAAFDWDGTRWQALGDWQVGPPEALALPVAPAGAENAGGARHAPCWLAGNAGPLYGARLPAALAALPHMAALPTAAAMLRLAPALLAAGEAVAPEQAAPLYVRDKVALTTAEREAAARAKAAHAASGGTP